MLHEGLDWKISTRGATPLRGAGSWRLLVGVSTWCRYLYCEISTTSWTQDLSIIDRFSFDTPLLFAQNTEHAVVFKLYLFYLSILHQNIFWGNSCFCLAPLRSNILLCIKITLFLLREKSMDSVTSFPFVFS